ncbi:MAG TPA: hypothetical protein PKG56_00090 [Chitinophagaceae bacterium]|nr:hypothetical protein [Chitinophagaceae bacterium]HNL81765.1 hypothetical protein [Chitinophagaceae bacterium]
MSNAPINPVIVQDPRVMIDKEKHFCIYSSGANFEMKPWTTTSISTSNLPFSTPPPSPKVLVDRKISLTLPKRLTLVGTAQDGYPLIQPGRDAPRAYPIHSMLDSISLTINGAQVTQSIGDIIHALLRFNNNYVESLQDYSQCPSALDISQQYSDLVNSVANPLSMYGDSNQRSQPGRGGFAGYKIVSNPVNNTGSPATLTAVVDILTTEQIMMSPLYFGNGDASAFTGVVSMDWQFNFLNQAANRCWSHADDPAISQITSSSISFGPFSGPSFSFSQSLPTLNINYITPKRGMLTTMFDRPLVYPYFKVNKYVTELGTSVTYGSGPQPFSTNSVQLSYCPRRLYLWARPSNNYYYSNPKYTDTFYGIPALAVQFDAQPSMLATAKQYQLYQLARANHCNIDWSNWSGQGFYPVGGNTFGTKFGGTGSVICLELNKDLQTGGDMYPGLNGNFNLQIDAYVQNIDPTGNLDNVPIALYLVTVDDAVFNIPASGDANTQLGVLNANMIMNAPMATDISYKDVEEVNGGDFLGTLSKAKAKILPKLKNANDYLKKNKTISNTADKVAQLANTPFLREIPYADKVRDYAEDTRDVAKLLGYGKGGVLVGGKKMTKKQLKDRIRQV